MTDINYTTISDEKLVALSLKNDNNFYHLAKRYENKLLHYIKRLVNTNLENCEDILQEVLIKTYKNLEGFDQNLKFSSWIYRIAHNEAISSFRKYKSQFEELSMEDDKSNLSSLLKSSLDTKKIIIDREIASEVKKILSLLKPKYREVLILKYFEEMDYKEISDILKKPMGTIATLLNRAKDNFKEEYNKQLT